MRNKEVIAKRQSRLPQFEVKFLYVSYTLDNTLHFAKPLQLNPRFVCRKNMDI